MSNPNLPPRPLEYDLLYDFLRVVEAAAIASARTMGQGERQFSDHVAVETMRTVMDTMPMDGTIVIGEGERDEAPCFTSANDLALARTKATGGPIPK